MLWDRAQLEGALALIRQRNAESDRGVVVITYIHGWQNNADPDRERNDLHRITGSMVRVGEQIKSRDSGVADRVVAVYLSWRGATNRFPLIDKTTFFDRKQVAERVSSYHMNEALFSITRETKQRADSKLVMTGHSMGGMILARTLAPSLTTMLLVRGEEGLNIAANLILLQNPALDALNAYKFVDFLKRYGVTVELHHEDGRVEEAPGPIMVSITSEADDVTRVAYRAGQIVDHFGTAFRSDLGEGVPSQGALANRAHGHSEFLISHRAWVEDGEVRLERVPGAFNDTPFWIVSVTKDISADHGDIRNPRMRQLTDQIYLLNRSYDTTVQTVVRTTNPFGAITEEVNVVP